MFFSSISHWMLYRNQHAKAVESQKAAPAPAGAVSLALEIEAVSAARFDVGPALLLFGDDLGNPGRD